MYALDNASAKSSVLPGLYCTVKSYGCKLNLMRCNLAGHLFKGFANIASNGLWSECIVICRPKI